MELKLQNIDEIKRRVDKSPSFNIEKIHLDTKKDPKWVAFGTGNIFRAYIARVAQDLIELGEFDRGINAIETRDPETIEKVYMPNDNLALSVTLKSDRNMSTELIASIGETVFINDNDRMNEIFKNKNLQIASYTITEKGYDIFDSSGNISENVLSDIENDPKKSNHLMVNTVGFLYTRFKENFPITLLSIDNLSHNGDVLKNSIVTIAKEYVKRGRYEKEFLDYLNDENKVAFPLSMIDKITPGPDVKVKEYLESKGFEDLGPYHRNKKSIIAKFVNSEEAEYLAIEDKFANGRPDFSKVGVYLVDRETVDKIETMKVTACLNPLHTCLAVYGCLLGYDRIYKEMEDKELVQLITKLAYEEALPVVDDPKVIDPEKFVKEVLEIRFPNPFMPDSPQRIATDTSLKIPVRFGKTLDTYYKNGLDVSKLKYIPLAIAGWLRYLNGVGDDGKKFELSPDPNLDELKDCLKGISLGNFKVTEELNKLLSNEKIFGVDLNKIGLSNKIISILRQLYESEGAIRKTLVKYTN